MKRILPILILFIAILPVIWALLPSGFYVSHDGEFNLVRLMHFYKELSEGQFPVRWAFDLNYRFGSSIFTFFYPLQYYLASLFHFLGFDFGTSLKAVIVLATIGSALLMHLWLARRFGALASLVGSLLYIYAPFRLLTMYVSGSFGVLLSLLFVPLAFLAIDGLAKTINIALLAVATFGLLTSHNVTALILLPVVVLYLLTLGKFLSRGFGGLVLGFGLAAFFILPALLETGYVFLSRGVVVNFADHFPTLPQLVYSPWGYFYSVAGEAGDGMSFQVGMAQWLVLGLTILTLLFRGSKKFDENSRLVVLFAFIFVLSIPIMLSVSKPIWEAIPLLPQIQFPWRILAIVVVVTPFLAAYLSETKYGKIVAIGLLLLLAWNNRNYLRTWEVTRYPDESYQKRESLYFGSTDIAWETRPIWVEEKPIWLAPKFATKTDEVTIRDQKKTGRKIEIQLSANQPAEFSINQFYYPTWAATVDGKSATIKPTDKTGLISVEVPQGEHNLVLTQEKTDLQEIADLISLLSVLVTSFLLIQSLRHHKDQTFSSSGYASGSRRKRHKISGWDGTLLQFLRNTV